MSAIETDEDFRLAAFAWLKMQTLQGTAFVDALERKIFDERPGGAVEITPLTNVLEAALDTGLKNAESQQKADLKRHEILNAPEMSYDNLVALVVELIEKTGLHSPLADAVKARKQEIDDRRR